MEARPDGESNRGKGRERSYTKKAEGDSQGEGQVENGTRIIGARGARIGGSDRLQLARSNREQLANWGGDEAGDREHGSRGALEVELR